MIKLDNVSLVFEGGSVALSNVSTEISEGEFVYLIGHSGSGKSSLLKLLYKDYSATKGEIEVVDMDVTTLPKWKIPLLRRKLGIVTQEPQLLEDRTTFENVSFQNIAKKYSTPAYCYSFNNLKKNINKKKY